MSARFGELLLNRRRELGLSIQQVANTIKIRPQIIEYFELGNFASMPPRGYAQGMISSYARFLGLNPTEIVNIYFDDLCAYENGGERRGGNLQGPAGPVSPRSSNESGRFYMVGSRPQSTRYGQRALQAGYVTENGSGSEIRAQRDRVRRTLPPAEASVPTASGTARNPRAGYGDGSYASGERGRMRSTRLASGSRSAQGSSRGRGDDRSRSQRNGSSSMQPNGRRRPVPTASGRTRAAGRDTYRDRGARRTPASRGRDGRRDPRSARGASTASFLAGFDPKFLIGVAAAILAILILLFVLLSRACSSNSSTTTLAEETAKAETTAKNSSSKSSSKKKKASSSTDDGDSDSSDDSDDTSTDQESSDTDDSSTDSTTDATETSSDSGSSSITVKVKVASKKTAFLEVRVDGKLVFGRQATGPLTKEYTASESIDITTSKPSYVTITKNGKKVRYDSTTAGVARVSLAVPKTSSSSSTEDADASDSSGDSQGSTDASSTQSSTSAASSGSSSASSASSVSSQ